MKKHAPFFLLHLSLFFGALIFESLPSLLAFAALAGFFPRRRHSFGYYLLPALPAYVLALVLQPPSTALQARLEALLGLGPVPLWLIIGLVTLITLALTAKAINALLAKQ